ncbi:hypothetical protein JY651_37580 [Pyxidicoccus parkwayensis]|uniref:Lipoprotein n=1 Tax=Pyxidicoccus parkwayensis TaxID=2813578 RepID=A0ABX7NR36_9BACT|nr:hypothetical protein [Pyxidicoccus parkwaysis]QSQ20893.1 hypothetical protein JY651_37580 [Pyxidicoccus parkwaysis]
MTLEVIRRSGLRWAGVLLLAAVSACSHGDKKDKAGDVKCAESRNLTCITGESCSLDRDRGCEVCRCADADALTPTDNRRPEAMQPTRFQ